MSAFVSNAKKTAMRRATSLRAALNSAAKSLVGNLKALNKLLLVAMNERLSCSKIRSVDHYSHKAARCVCDCGIEHCIAVAKYNVSKNARSVRVIASNRKAEGNLGFPRGGTFKRVLWLEC